MEKMSSERYWRLIILSGALIIASFVATFLMVIKIIPERYYGLSFLTYAMSFLGLYLFLYTYYHQYLAAPGSSSE